MDQANGPDDKKIDGVNQVTERNFESARQLGEISGATVRTYKQGKPGGRYQQTDVQE